ncbi:MAG: PHP-associated domain-containing protein [Caldilineaceae bacterium]
MGLGEHSVKHAIQHLPFDAVEVRHGCPLNVIGNRYARYLNRQAQNLAELGSSDSHIPYTAGEAYTWFPGTSALHVRRGHPGACAAPAVRCGRCATSCVPPPPSPNAAGRTTYAAPRW